MIITVFASRSILDRSYIADTTS